MTDSTLRADYARSAEDCVRWALENLEAAMQFRPGPYPDPAVPITKWQHAHAHLTAARDLLTGASSDGDE